MALLNLARALTFAALLLPSFCNAADFGAMRRQVRDLGRLTAPPAVHPAEGFAAIGTIRPLFFDGLPYRGKATRVFAWYGTPANRTGKVPGIVLVHGGGGTAFKEWVQKWNDRGFAAISIAVEGQTDEHIAEARPAVGRSAWKQHAWAGPAREGIYADTGQPLTDQWMYHALADTVMANSLIRSFAEVNAAKVGVMGISWGGVIAATVMGIDDRFAFSIPTYGCGVLADAENHWGRALHDNTVYREVWDPVLYLPSARMPAFWFTWLHDIHFPLTSQSASYRAAPGAHMVAVLPDMKHSHPAGWNPPESYAFAESVVRNGGPWLRLLRTENGGTSGFVEFSSTKNIDGAILFSTPDSGFTGERKWTETAVPVEQKSDRIRVTATLPPNTRAWFVNIRAGNVTASSDFIERAVPGAKP